VKNKLTVDFEGTLLLVGRQKQAVFRLPDSSEKRKLIGHLNQSIAHLTKARAITLLITEESLEVDGNRSSLPKPTRAELLEILDERVQRDYRRKR
jgi:hypothetical protein